MRSSLALLMSACAIAAPASAQTFSPERIRADVAFLADDLLEGRNAGERGYDIAAHYVAAEFRKLGLQPAAGASYFQSVPFVKVGLDKAHPASITIAGQRFANGIDIVTGATPLVANQDEEAEIVFVGHGLEDPRFGLDDYAGLDVKGKVVAYLYGAPKSVPSEEAASLNSTRGKTIASKGAIGSLMLFTPALEKLISWDDLSGYADEESFRWVAPDGKPHIENPTLRIGGTLGTKAAAALLKGSAMEWPALLKAMEDPTARPKGFVVRNKARLQRVSKIEKISSPNVVG